VLGPDAEVGDLGARRLDQEARRLLQAHGTEPRDPTRLLPDEDGRVRVAELAREQSPDPRGRAGTQRERWLERRVVREQLREERRQRGEVPLLGAARRARRGQGRFPP
jgi:hypothetical protein